MADKVAVLQLETIATVATMTSCEKSLIDLIVLYITLKLTER